jgi:sugar phosphate isomerase/epimerase
MLRGSILGQGDLDIADIIASIKASGFDGYVSIEFEGMEDPRAGSIGGLQAANYFAAR